MKKRKCPRCKGRGKLYFHEIANFKALLAGKAPLAGELKEEYICDVCGGSGWMKEVGT